MVMVIEPKRSAKREAPSKRAAKTEVLSMRMDPKTRFLVEVLARNRGQSISTVVERAILESADNAHIGGSEEGRTWRDYWHISEGVRALKMAADQGLYPTYEDECRLVFARTHWPFFYTESNCKLHKPWCIDILWPRIDEFLEMWDETKSSDYFATGKAMQQALRDAGIQAPDWPPKAPEKLPPPPPPKPAGRPGPSWDAPKGGDLDDEIPF